MPVDLSPAAVISEVPNAVADGDPVIMLPVSPPIHVRRSVYEAWLRGEAELPPAQ